MPKVQTTPGDRILRVPLPGLRVGVAERGDGATGCTVFYFPGRAFAVADPRGGACATVCSDRLIEGGAIDAICLAGGSVFGLAAASGVAQELFARRQLSTHWDDLPVVAGAVIYDFGVRQDAGYPDAALGAAALRSAEPGLFPLGPRGAGRSASVGKWLLAPYQRELTGQGGAYARVGDAVVAVFTVVNAVGGITDRTGAVVRGHLDPTTNRRVRAGSIFPSRGASPGNTTLTVVVTNLIMDAYHLRQLARQVHSSMARAIDPFGTAFDGDVLYAVGLNEVTTDALNPHEAAVLASELAWDAVLEACTRDETPRDRQPV